MGTRGRRILYPVTDCSYSGTYLKHGYHRQMGQRIAILVVHAEIEPFEGIREATHDLIYRNASKSGIDVFYLVGNSRSSNLRRAFNNAIEKNRHSRYFLFSRFYDFVILNLTSLLPRSVTLKNNYIRVNTPEDLRHLGFKLISALKLLQEMDYQWVLRTTTSSVVNIDKLKGISDELSREEKPIFAGAVAERSETHNFIIGSCLLMNKLAIEFILKNRKRWDHSLLDDVALSRIASRTFELIPLKQISITDECEAKRMEKSDLESTLVVRCKTALQPRGDIGLIKAVDSRMKNSQI